MTDMRDNPNVDYCIYCAELVDVMHSFKTNGPHIWHTACAPSDENALMISDLRARLATARSDALREAAEICDEECHNLNALTCNPPKSAAAWGARNRILALIDKETGA